MESNILVVDDEKEIRELIAINLSNEGYNVFKASSGLEAIEIFEHNTVHLIVLDIMMPGIDGFEVCRRIRQKSNIPILMLSAKSENMDKVEGILTGADDYLIKPFDSLELSVRVKALLRRAYYFNHTNVVSNCIEVQSLLIDKDTHKVTCEGKEIVLTATEFGILYLLASNRGKVFPSEEIFEKVWNEKYFDSNNTVMVHVSRLREKLKRYTGEKIIHTIWGVGYSIEK